MPLNAYLNFPGNTREAVLYYASVFGLDEPQIITFGEHSAEGIPSEAKDLVMHARLEIEGSSLMFSDVFPGMPFQQGSNFSLALVTKDEQLLAHSFDQLKQGGEVQMELQETSWTKLYGAVIDKFGVAWQFNYDQS